MPSIQALSLELSPQAILTVAPVFVALMTLQANVPSVIFLRGQGYEPPASMIDAVSGLGATGASFFGPTGLSLAFIAMPFTAGPEAGDLRTRHRSVYAVSAWGIAIALLSTTAAGLAIMIPVALLRMLAGLAILELLINSLRQIASGPLLLGPIFTFAIAVSGVELWQLGPFFWALVVGTTVSAVLEHDEWVRLRSPAAPVG